MAVIGVLAGGSIGRFSLGVGVALSEMHKVK